MFKALQAHNAGIRIVSLCPRADLRYFGHGISQPCQRLLQHRRFQKRPQSPCPYGHTGQQIPTDHTRNFLRRRKLQYLRGAKGSELLQYVVKQYNFGLCHMALGHKNDAVACFENALSKDGNLYIQKQAKQNLHKLKGENQNEPDIY